MRLNHPLGKDLVLILLVISTVGCDRITKHLAVRTLADSPSRTYLAQTVRFEYAENTGAFLSLGADLPSWLRGILFTAGPAIMLFAMAGFAWKYQVRGLALSGLGLIAAGGGSNLFDRIVHGSVIDFMNVGIGSLRTGVFNVADVAILAGIILFALWGTKKAATVS